MAVFVEPVILFEDNHILVAVKPAGVLSQEDATGAPDMLTILKSYLKKKYDKPGNVYLGLLHRLDRPVSGVMVFAKTSKAASRISEQIREKKMVKRYRAVVQGVPPLEEDTLRGWLLKDEKSNRTTVFKDVAGPPPTGAKLSVLKYKVVKIMSDKGGRRAFLEIDLLTGRSHQIRAQLADLGCPILGDGKYGRKSTDVPDIALEAFSLSFAHPITKDMMTFVLP